MNEQHEIAITRTISTKPSFWDMIKEAAGRARLSTSEFIRQAVTEKIARDQIFGEQEPGRYKTDENQDIAVIQID